MCDLRLAEITPGTWGRAWGDGLGREGGLGGLVAWGRRCCGAAIRGSWGGNDQLVTMGGIILAQTAASSCCLFCVAVSSALLCGCC